MVQLHFKKIEIFSLVTMETNDMTLRDPAGKVRDYKLDTFIFFISVI